jgi:hypothetical protein
MIVEIFESYKLENSCRFRSDREMLGAPMFRVRSHFAALPTRVITCAPQQSLSFRNRARPQNGQADTAGSSYYTDTLAHYTAQVVVIFRNLDKEFRDFDPNAIVRADVLDEQVRERILAQVALCLAELSREVLDEERRDGKPEAQA